MLWLIAVIVLITLWLYLRDGGREANQDAPVPLSYRTLVSLHAIHRRFELARFKHELHRDAAEARRALHDELRRLHDQEWPD